GPGGAARRSPAHTEAVTSVAALRTDLCVSGGRDKAVAVCSWSSGAVLRRFLGHQREVTKVSTAPASGRVFSASRDRTVLMWELEATAGPSQHFAGHELVVTGLAVSPDGSQLCTGSRDNTVCQWDTETGQRLARAAISRNLVTHLCWVPGEPYVIQSSEDKTIRRRNPPPGGCEAWDRLPREEAPSLDGEWKWEVSLPMAGVLPVALQLWDLRQTRSQVCEYRGHFQTTTSCVFLPRGPALAPSIATSSCDSTVKVWDRDTGACLATLYLEGSGPLASLAACDSSTLLCAGSGIHLLRLRDGRGLALEEVAVF
ncbi:WD repeat-containing protein 31, partial [Dryobates pubescens]